MHNTTTSAVIRTLAVMLFLSCAISALAAENSNLQPPKRIWAHNLLWTDAPKLELGEWLTDEPELEGKFILVEFWRTWCGACRRMTPMMNELHEKYGDDLVVIGITGEPIDRVKAALPKWKKEYYLAMDAPRAEADAEAEDAPTCAEGAASDDGEPCVDPDAEGSVARSGEQGAYEAKYGVWGWPHVVLLEPKYRGVVWQGFPGLKGHELTVEKVGKYIEASRKADQ